MQAQIFKTIDITNAGSISTVLTSLEKQTITNLTITGTIDARDFKTLRDNMTSLVVLDISKVTITSYYGSSGTSNISSSVNYPANAIPQNAFCVQTTSSISGKTTLVSVILPESISLIGINAFYRCNNLKTIKIPNQVLVIEKSAFTDCSNLVSIDFDSISVIKTIGNQAFMGCINLLKINIPSTIDSIGDYAFCNCVGLSIVSFAKPSKVTFLGKYAFANCSNITNIKIPSSIISIDDYAFGSYAYGSGLTSLKSVTFDSLSSLKSIGFSSFGYTKVLDEILIPSSVQSISYGSFIRSSTLIIVDSTNQKYSSRNGVLFDKNQKTLIHFPCSFRGDYKIPLTVDTIQTYAFENCRGLKSVTIPTSVKSINKWAFNLCDSLESVNFIQPSILTSIGDYAFINCYKLISFPIPETVNYIGDYAFGECKSLIVPINIPSSVYYIGNYAFKNCTSINQIYSKSIYPLNLNSSNGVFTGVDKTKSILFVPKGYKNSYKIANQWKDFNNIIEGDTFIISNQSVKLTDIANSSSTITINSSITWVATSDQQWLTLNKTTSNGFDTLIFTAEANTSLVSRTAIVTISANGIASQIITITQKAKTVSSNSINNIIKDYYYAVGNTIYFNNNESCVYSLLGQRLSNIGDKSISLNKGIYIIQTPAGCDKILVEY